MKKDRRGPLLTVFNTGGNRTHSVDIGLDHEEGKISLQWRGGFLIYTKVTVFHSS